MALLGQSRMLESQALSRRSLSHWGCTLTRHCSSPELIYAVFCCLVDKVSSVSLATVPSRNSRLETGQMQSVLIVNWKLQTYEPKWPSSFYQLSILCIFYSDGRLAVVMATSLEGLITVFLSLCFVSKVAWCDGASLWGKESPIRTSAILASLVGCWRTLIMFQA